MNELSKAAAQTNADKATLIIEGYADQLSVQAGEQIGFHISTNAATYAIEIARVGAVREPVWSRANLAGHQYPTPENASSYGCNWPVALRLRFPRAGNPATTAQFCEVLTRTGARRSGSCPLWSGRRTPGVIRQSCCN